MARGAYFVLIAGVCLLVPSLAEAHPSVTLGHGWSDGFNHPLHGWDHLVVMVAVGLWAGQQAGRARWAIPLTFLASMAAGGIMGAAAVSLPFVQIMILVSVVVLSGLALLRRRFSVLASLSIVALFAIFHGYAHGQEMPNSATLVTFGAGFLLATALLHLSGYAFARLALAAATLGVPGTAFAQQTPGGASSPGMAEIVITGRQSSLIGVADSATQGTVGAEELEQRPILRAGEILETVPGVIITQHAGGGKANQYFLRGFNLDHGTDFLTTLDGMPVNFPSHAHGQGYSDLNIVIPELISRVNYQKGVYYAENGDFSSAGSAHLESFKTLPNAIATVEGGTNGYGRVMGADSFAIGAGSLLFGVDVTHEDGPWVRPDNFLKEIGVVTYSQGSASDGFSVTARGYHGTWNSSDQIAASAVATGLIPLYGTLNPTDGGNSQRYSLQGEWHRADAGAATKIDAYALYYDFSLFSDFTYYLVDPVHGDQFEQRDKRLSTGLNASHTLFQQWSGHAAETAFGFQFRNDDVHTDLFQTENRRRIFKMNEDGTIIPDVTRADSVVENSVGLYVENKLQWTDHLRTVVGLREDIFNFNVDAGLPANSGSRTATITSPKLTVILGPWSDIELYAQGGLGYHSNDARGVLTHVDPLSGARVDSEGNAITPATPLVAAKGPKSASGRR